MQLLFALCRTLLLPSLLSAAPLDLRHTPFTDLTVGVKIHDGKVVPSVLSQNYWARHEHNSKLSDGYEHNFCPNLTESDLGSSDSIFGPSLNTGLSESVWSVYTPSARSRASKAVAKND